MVKALSSILLACLVLLSGITWNVNLHLCKNEVKGLAFFGEAEKCSHYKKPKEENTCPFHSSRQDQQKNDCCSDEDITIKSSDVEAISTTALEIPAQVVSDVVFSAVDLSYFGENDTTSYLVHAANPPPLIERDIPVLVQSFLL